jgi:drug/metabolite transporter (DMT)-like permease
VLDVFAEKPVKLHILNMAVLLSAVMGCTHKNIRMVNARAVLAVLGAPVAVAVQTLLSARLPRPIPEELSPILNIAMRIPVVAVAAVVAAAAAKRLSASRTKLNITALASKSVSREKPTTLIVLLRD